MSLQDADASEIKVQVCVYAFDLLYLNGDSLVQKPFRRRRELLRESFQEIDGEFVFATSMISSNTEEISEFLDESIKGNNWWGFFCQNWYTLRFQSTTNKNAVILCVAVCYLRERSTLVENMFHLWLITQNTVVG